jgi:hypothetical protein
MKLIALASARFAYPFDYSANMALNLAPFSRWMLLDKSAQRPLLQGLPYLSSNNSPCPAMSLK